MSALTADGQKHVFMPLWDFSTVVCRSMLRICKLEVIGSIPIRSMGGRVAGGVAARGSLGSRRESLPSPGSSDQPLVRAGPLPVREEAGLACLQSGPPALELFVGPQPLVFLPGPALQVE